MPTAALADTGQVPLDSAHRTTGVADDVFDAYLAIAKMQSEVFFQKGIIIALEMTRQCNEKLLLQSKEEFSVLERKKEILLKKFWTMYPQHLVRNNVRIFIREDKQISCSDVGDAGDAGDGGDGGDGGNASDAGDAGDGGDASDRVVVVTPVTACLANTA